MWFYCHQPRRPLASRGLVVHRVTIVPVRLEDVLVDDLALLRIDLTGALVGAAIQGLLNGNSNGGPGLLLLSPVQDELVPHEDAQKFLGDPLDLTLIILRQVRSGTVEEVEAGRLVIVE